MRAIVATAMAMLCWPVTAPAQSQHHPDYLNGYSAWRESRYPDASVLLSRYRTQQPYGRTYEVDYWIGTSWCRIGDKRPAGANLLGWAYRFQDMPDEELPKFWAEIQSCGANKTPALVHIAAAPRSTAGVQAKIFYLAGDKHGIGLGAAPLRVVKPIGADELARRIFALTRSDAARTAAASRLPGSRAVSSGRFVLASTSPGHTEVALQAIGARLEHFVKYLEREYGLVTPDALITVYLVPDSPALVKLAADLHGIAANPATLGYAFQNDLSVVAALTGTAAGTLLHELFHLVVRSGFADIPQFLDEGLAALYETSTLVGDTYWGAPNWRGKVLKSARENQLTLPLRDVIISPWFSDRPGGARREGMPTLDVERQAYVLSASRYFLIWLQQEGLLQKVFREFRDRELPDTPVAADEQAVALLVRGSGRPFAALESGFNTWLRLAERLDTGQAFRTLGKAPPGGIAIEKELPIDREKSPGSD